MAVKPGKKAGTKLDPKILIFDVDGVLVDVRESYWRSGLQTVRELTGKKPTWKELYERKRKPGNNDDWRMVARWATTLGVPTSYEEARVAFQPFYWGRDGKPGNVTKEKLLVTPKLIEKWGKGRELNLFTGRTRQEFAYTFDRWPAAKLFRTIVTMDDAKKKPHPEGLRIILDGRDRATGITLMTRWRRRRRAYRSWRFFRRRNRTTVSGRRSSANSELWGCSNGREI